MGFGDPGRPGEALAVTSTMNILELSHDGSMVLPYMVTWIPFIYPLYVSIYTSTMDPSWVKLPNTLAQVCPRIEVLKSPEPKPLGLKKDSLWPDHRPSNQ